MAVIIDVNEQEVLIDHNNRIITVSTSELRFSPRVGDEVALTKDHRNEIKVLLITRDSSFPSNQQFGNSNNFNNQPMEKPNSFAFKCAVIGLFIFGIILGPIAIFKHKKDSRPGTTLILGIIATLGAIVMIYLNQKLFNSIFTQ